MSNVTQLAELYPDAETYAMPEPQKGTEERSVALPTQFPGPAWYAVTVCPRHERKVADYLKGRGVGCFVPTYRSIRRWKDRRKELDMVLFPGYAFMNVAPGGRLIVLKVPGVVRFVTCGGQPVPVADHEISAIRNSIAAGASLQPHPYLTKGRRVRLIRGALAGLEGIMVRRKDRFRLILSVELIMRSIALEVDECEVEPC